MSVNIAQLTQDSRFYISIAMATAERCSSACCSDVGHKNTKFPEFPCLEPAVLNFHDFTEIP